MIHLSKNGWLFIATALSFFCSAFAGAARAEMKFSMPMNCTLEQDCWIQNLVDIDKTPQRQDPFCGTATFDKHKGTDFRVRTLSDLKTNIPALAMADGTVLALRNDMDDHLVENPDDVKKIKGKECGNGALVSHGNGWTTQYCHLAKDSVSVKKGEKLKRGDTIGLLGLSGHTTFPHVHVTFRKGKTVVDPMTGLAQGESCSDKRGLGDETLWDAAARSQIIGASTALLEAGFSSEKVSGAQVLKGTVAKPRSKRPLIFYAHFINLKEGDRIDLKISGPGGVIVNREGEPLAKPKASWTTFVGKRGALPPGRYTGSARLIRDSKIIASRDDVEVYF